MPSGRDAIRLAHNRGTTWQFPSLGFASHPKCFSVSVRPGLSVFPLLVRRWLLADMSPREGAPCVPSAPNGGMRTETHMTGDEDDQEGGEGQE